MKRSWQIWSLLAGCLLAVLGLMAWLTERALRLEHTEAMVRQQHQLEESVGNALWQMDAELTRLLAPEVARPPSDFGVHEVTIGKSQSQTHRVINPSIPFESPYVKQYFEVSQDDRWKTPSRISNPKKGMARSPRNGSKNVDHPQNQLAQSVTFARLLSELPNSDAPQADVTQNDTRNALPQFGNDRFNNSLQQVVAQQQETSDQAPRQQAKPSRQKKLDSQAIQSLQQRNTLLQSAAQSVYLGNRASLNEPTEFTSGTSQPIWIDAKLLLARQVIVNGSARIQGCWLDWDRLKSHLLDLTIQLVPGAKLEPVSDFSSARLSRVLATIPAQLVLPEAPIVVSGWTPIRIAVLLGWTLLLFALVAVVVLVRSILMLSERRAAFVSAVTHELRTPLTTFRMYSEMLAEGMVTDSSQRDSYLTTLRNEAERLSMLVENVLQYARLERGSMGKQRETIQVDELMHRLESRLARRTEKAQFELQLHSDDQSKHEMIATDPTAIEQIVFNLVDNACKYASNSSRKKVDVTFLVRDHLQIRVRDYGNGIPADTVKSLFQPFAKTANETADASAGVGLGLALCRRLAKELNGSLTLEKNDSSGVVFLFQVRLV